MENQISIIINGVRYDAVETEKPKCEGCAFFGICTVYDTHCSFLEDVHGEDYFVKSDKKVEV